MKQMTFDLLGSIVTVYGDTTKTYVTQRMKTRTVGGKLVLGPPRNLVIPVFDDFGVAPISCVVTNNNRLFMINAPVATTLCRVMLYDFNTDTGIATSVGSLNMQIPAGTQTVRAFKVDDGANNAQVTNWNLFLGTTNATTAANGGPFMAKLIAKTDFTSSPITIPTATTADSKQVYKLENPTFTLTAMDGMDFDRASTRLYVRNGTAAVWQMAKFNYSTGTGTPGANGVTTTGFEFITGNLQATSGTLIQTNSDYIMTPQHGINAGFLCYLFSTSTTAYHGRVSELTSGLTVWSTVATNNYNMPTRFINPTVTAISWSVQLDRLIAFGSPDLIVVKKLENAQYDYVFGTSHRQFWESGFYTTQPLIPFGAQTITQFDSNGSGWLFGVSTAASQRGLVGTCIDADARWEQQYIITKVLNLGDLYAFGGISLIRQLNKYTSVPKVQYRLSGFGSISGGWLDWPENLDGSMLLVGSQIQLKIFNRQHDEFITNAAQIEQALISFLGKFENTDKWNMDIENSTKVADGTARSAAILIKAYDVSVPAIEMFAFSRASGLVVKQKNTQDHAAEFQYSSNSGLAWNALGTIPNVINTTRLRYNWGSPIPEDVDIVWREK